ncbi:MAG: hypothetical protein ACE5HS_19400 [bacterium]
MINWHEKKSHENDQKTQSWFLWHFVLSFTQNGLSVTAAWFEIVNWNRAAGRSLFLVLLKAGQDTKEKKLSLLKKL